MKGLAISPRLWRYGALMAIRGSTIVLKFGLSFYVARFIGLGALGTYGLVVGLSLTAPVFVRAGLFTTIARQLVDAEPSAMTYDLKHYLVWVGGCYGLLLLLIPLLLQIDGLSSLQASVYVIWAIVLGEHLALDVTLLLNNLNRSEAANLFGLGQSAVWVIPFVAASWLIPSMRSFDALLAFWAVGTFVTLAGVSTLFWEWPWKASRALNLEWYWQRLKASGYLFFSDLIGTVSQFIDRYMIAYFISIEQAGVYTLFFQLANSVFTLISSSIVNVHRPKIISAFSGHRMQDAASQLRQLQLEAVFVFIGLSLVVGGAFQFAAPWINRPAVLLFMPLMWFTFAATALKTWCLTGFIELYARHYDAELFWLNLLGFAVITALSLAAIPFAGIYGIPVAIGVSYAFVLLLIRVTVARKDRHLAGLG